MIKLKIPMEFVVHLFNYFNMIPQFWGAEKDTSRIESAIFEDLNRYCWSQQNNSGVLSNQSGNTDGQVKNIYIYIYN